MGNVFDRMKARTFDVAARTMGYDATWVPSDGSTPEGLTARVLFNNPTEKQRASGIEYDPLNWKFEYRFDKFAGLREAANDGTSEEVVTIDGNEYYVRKVNPKWDGGTFYGNLEPVN